MGPLKATQVSQAGSGPKLIIFVLLCLFFKHRLKKKVIAGKVLKTVRALNITRTCLQSKRLRFKLPQWKQYGSFSRSGVGS